MYPIELNGSLVRLREFSADDAAWYLNLPTITEMWRYTWMSAPADLAAAHTTIDAILTQAHQEPRLNLTLIVESLADDQPAGVAHLAWQRIGVGAIGWHLTPDYWNRGYATEVTQLLATYAFNHIGYHRVNATCDPRNQASRRVLEKSGFTLEGELHHGYFRPDTPPLPTDPPDPRRTWTFQHEGHTHTGHWVDRLVYRLLDHEWRHHQTPTP